MYAQHHHDSPGRGSVFVLHGSYTNHMLRMPDGWRIERLIQHVTWREDR